MYFDVSLDAAHWYSWCSCCFIGAKRWISIRTRASLVNEWLTEARCSYQPWIFKKEKVSSCWLVAGQSASRGRCDHGRVNEPGRWTWLRKCQPKRCLKAQIFFFGCLWSSKKGVFDHVISNPAVELVESGSEVSPAVLNIWNQVETWLLSFRKNKGLQVLKNVCGIETVKDKRLLYF